MLIDGRGENYSLAYDKFEKLITEEGCLLDGSIEILVDEEVLAKKINILASLAGYDTLIKSREGYWKPTVDVTHRQCR